MGYVYVFEFPNGKRYVGQTTQEPDVRWNGNYNGKVKEAISYFGKKNIRRYYFAVPNELLDDTERSVIQWLNTMDSEYGYNVLNGGRKGFTLPEEIRKKDYDSHIGKHPTTETRKKMSESHIGERHHMYGKQHSDETRRKMSEARRLWWIERKKGLTS